MAKGDNIKSDLKQHYRNQQGKDYIEYPGLLGEAHRLGVISIQTVLIQIPGASNDQTAIVQASVTMPGDDGGPDRVFSGIGDASPKNVNKMLVNALIRMAETRAKGRALRDAVNIGETMYEELPGSDTHEADEPDNDDGDKPASATQLRQIKDLADEVGEALAIPNDLSSADAEAMIGKLESTATDQRNKLKTVKKRLNEAMTQLADKSGDSQNEIVDRIKKSVGIKTAKVSEATLDQLLDAEKYVLAALDKAA